MTDLTLLSDDTITCGLGGVVTVQVSVDDGPQPVFKSADGRRLRAKVDDIGIWSATWVTTAVGSYPITVTAGDAAPVMVAVTVEYDGPAPPEPGDSFVDDAVTAVLSDPDSDAAQLLLGAYASKGLPSWAGSRSGIYDPTRCLYNWHAGNTRRWRTALARARAGLDYARLNCYGDSITQGSGAASPLHVNAWPSRLRDKFDDVMGPAGTGVCYVGPDGDDTRFAKSGSWFPYNDFSAYGTWSAYSDTPGQWYSFTADNCDGFRIYTFGTVGAGPLGISVDGGTVVNVANSPYSPNQPIALTLDPVTWPELATPGTHTVKVEVVTGLVILHGFEATLGEAGVRLTRWGRSSATAKWLVEGQGGDAASLTAGSLPTSFNVMSPDLSTIAFGVNEFLQHKTLVEYRAALDTIVLKAKEFGDVLLITGAPNADVSSTPSQGDYAGELYDLADATDVALFDLGAYWGSHADNVGLYEISDATHPNEAGYYDIADAVYRIVGTEV